MRSTNDQEPLIDFNFQRFETRDVDCTTIRFIRQIRIAVYFRTRFSVMRKIVFSVADDKEFKRFLAAVVGQRHREMKLSVCRVVIIANRR